MRFVNLLFACPASMFVESEASFELDKNFERQAKVCFCLCSKFWKRVRICSPKNIEGKIDRACLPFSSDREVFMRFR